MHGATIKILGRYIYGSFLDTVSISHYIASTLIYLVNDELATIPKAGAVA